MIEYIKAWTWLKLFCYCNYTIQTDYLTLYVKTLFHQITVSRGHGCTKTASTHYYGLYQPLQGQSVLDHPQEVYMFMFSALMSKWCQLR